MTPRGIIYDIREQFKLMTDDNEITDLYILWLLDRARGVVFGQKYSDPRNLIPTQEYQSISVPIAINGVSTIAIPSVIKTTGNYQSSMKVYGVGIADTNINVPVNVVSIDRLPYVGGNQFNMDQIYAAINDNGYIALNSRNNTYKMLNNVSVRALFDDTQAAHALSGISTKYLDYKYPISDINLKDVITIVNEKISIKLQLLNDINDGTTKLQTEKP